jgi:ParB family chromosome partitioning protein
MARFVPEQPLAGLRGVDYNPRRITELRESLSRLGVCKPIIVSGGLIVAGHQRTRSLRLLGIETAPAIMLDDVSTEDEIRFNQLHNGTDFDAGDEAADVGPAGCEPREFEMVPIGLVRGNMRAAMANVRAEICKLTLRYGNWGGCVATMSGRVIHAAQYVLACKALGLPVRTFRVPDEMADEAAALLNRQYGVFSYAHLDRKTYRRSPR